MIQGLYNDCTVRNPTQVKAFNNDDFELIHHAVYAQELGQFLCAFMPPESPNRAEIRKHTIATIITIHVCNMYT